MNEYFGLSPIALASYETLTLERLKLGVQTSIGANVRESIRLGLDEDIWNGMIYRLTADILAEKLPPERVERTKVVMFDIPASSWQMFKQEHEESWWLGWLVRRRPVRHQTHEQTVTLTVDLQKYRTFPKCDYVFPDSLGSHVNVAVTHDYWSLR